MTDDDGPPVAGGKVQKPHKKVAKAKIDRIVCERNRAVSLLCAPFLGSVENPGIRATSGPFGTALREAALAKEWRQVSRDRGEDQELFVTRRSLGRRNQWNGVK
jgi:hypothetical protein